MCVAAGIGNTFDPDLCPLLAGLGPEERARRMQQPWIKACIEGRRGSVAGTPDHELCVTLAHSGEAADGAPVTPAMAEAPPHQPVAGRR